MSLYSVDIQGIEARTGISSDNICRIIKKGLDSGKRVCINHNTLTKKDIRIKELKDFIQFYEEKGKECGKLISNIVKKKTKINSELFNKIKSSEFTQKIINIDTNAETSDFVKNLKNDIKNGNYHINLLDPVQNRLHLEELALEIRFFETTLISSIYKFKMSKIQYICYLIELNCVVGKIKNSTSLGKINQAEIDQYIDILSNIASTIRRANVEIYYNYRAIEKTYNKMLEYIETKYIGLTNLESSYENKSVLEDNYNTNYELLNNQLKLAEVRKNQFYNSSSSELQEIIDSFFSDKSKFNELNNNSTADDLVVNYFNNERITNLLNSRCSNIYENNKLHSYKDKEIKFIVNSKDLNEESKSQSICNIQNKYTELLESNKSDLRKIDEEIKSVAMSYFESNIFDNQEYQLNFLDKDLINFSSVPLKNVLVTNSLNSLNSSNPTSITNSRLLLESAINTLGITESADKDTNISNDKVKSPKKKNKLSKKTKSDILDFEYDDDVDINDNDISSIEQVFNNLDTSINNYLDVFGSYSYAINQQVISEEDLEQFVTVILPKRKSLINIVNFSKVLKNINLIKDEIISKLNPNIQVRLRFNPTAKNIIVFSFSLTNTTGNTTTNTNCIGHFTFHNGLSIKGDPVGPYHFKIDDGSLQYFNLEYNKIENTLFLSDFDKSNFDTNIQLISEVILQVLNENILLLNE